MSLATRCPNCGTVFRVVSDQLRLSGGQVRCGICEVVFNGLEHLQADVPLAAPAPAPAELPTVGIAARRQAVPDSGFEAEMPPELAPPQVVARPHLEFPEPFAAVAHPPGPVQGVEPALSVAVLPAESPPEPFIADPPPESLQVLRSGRSPQAWSATSLDLDEREPPFAEPLPPAAEDPAADAPLGQPPEVVGSPDRALDVVEPPPWIGEPPLAPRRWPWALAAVLLTALALVQALHLSRDWVASQWPAARPWMQAYCDRIGCELSWPRRLEALQVLASQLEPQAARPSVYRLAMTVRNRHDQPQPWPAIEITILDRQDRVIVRRVLAADDWRPSAGIETTELAARSDVELAFDLELEGPGVSGYRVALFFP